jgi:hypothetical protein
MFRSTCFGRLHVHHQELTTALTASGFALERDGSSVVDRGLARLRQTTLLPPRSKLKPGAVNAVVSS